MSLFSSGFFIIDQLVMISAFCWLVADGAWSALGWGVAAVFAIAFLVGLSMTAAGLLATPAGILYKKNKKILSSILFIPFIVLSAVIYSGTFIYTEDFFPHYRIMRIP
jgi:hypothetical protein